MLAAKSTQLGRGAAASYVKQRQRLVQPINDYLSQVSVVHKEDAPSCLILDGTGPRLTVQLPYLSAMGPERVTSFNKIIAFSGGIGAYCVYLAQQKGYLHHELSHYFAEIDKRARGAHRLSFWAYPGLINKYLSKKPLYNRLCYMDLFRYVVLEEFLQLPLDQVAPNFIPFVAFPGEIRPVAVTKENGFDRGRITIADVMAAGMKIPHIYTSSESDASVSRLESAFDATYLPGYWSVRSRLSEAHATTVVLTMNTHNLSDQACVVDVLKGKNPRYQLAFDILTLLFNLPNKRYQRDLQLAYV